MPRRVGPAPHSARGYVDAGIDPDIDLAEQHVPEDPGHRLTREAAFDDGAQHAGVSGGMRHEVVGLLLGRDEPRFGEARDERRTVGRERHVRHWSTLRRHWTPTGRARWTGLGPEPDYVWPDEGVGFRPAQQRWGGLFPFAGSGALNRLYVHP